MTTGVGVLSIACFSLVVAACADSSPAPATPADPPSPRACQDAYQDLVQYYESDPERRRPPALREDTFVSACRELPDEAQRCMLFSYNQSHSARCDQAIKDAPPEVMRRIAATTGK